MRNSDFVSFVLGPTAGSENQDTLRLWRKAEAAWRRSPLSGLDHVQLATEILGKSVALLPRSLAPTLQSAFVEAATQFLAREEIGTLEVDWGAVNSDPVAAVQFRQ